MSTSIEPITDIAGHETAETLCERGDCVAGVVSRNIRAVITRSLDAEDHLDVVMEEIFCTAVLLALFEAHGIPLDTPTIDSEVTLPIVNRIGAELGLIGCTASVPSSKRRSYGGH